MQIASGFDFTAISTSSPLLRTAEAFSATKSCCRSSCTSISPASSSRNRRTLLGVQVVALRIHFRERDRWDQDGIVKRSKRICFHVGFRQVVRFIQTEREQSVITFLV